jgi:hypothetical protein
MYCIASCAFVGGGGSVFWRCVQFVSYSFAPHRTCLVSPAVLANQPCSQVCRVLSHRRWPSSLVLYRMCNCLTLSVRAEVIHWALQIVNSCSYWNTFVFRLLKHKLCLQCWYLAHKYIIQFVEWIILYVCGIFKYVTLTEMYNGNQVFNRNNRIYKHCNCEIFSLVEYLLSRPIGQ